MNQYSIMFNKKTRVYELFKWPTECPKGYHGERIKTWTEAEFNNLIRLLIEE